MSVERMSPWPWQEAAFASLIALGDRLPHALLLHGARGIGKRHLATCFAHAVLCEARTRDGSACGNCPACSLLAAGNHPDLREIVPAADQIARDEAEEEGDAAADTTAGRRGKPSREVRIDQVRDLADFLTVTTHRGGLRVVLLAPAEALNAAAANALLKMLEEPPQATVFVLVSDELDAVLPTVRSRCMLVRVPSPTSAQGLAWLKQQGVDEAERRLAEAGGAPLLAASAANEDDARALAPAVREALLELLSRGGTLSGAEIAGAVPKDVAVGAAIRLFQCWGWDLLGERTAQRVRYYPSERRVLTTLARSAEPTRLIGWLDELADAQALSDHPLNGRLAIESALIGYMKAMRPAA
jgi:DNA polymerase-3 subunit delta'